MGSLMRFKLDEFVERFKLQAFVETGTGRGDSLAYAATRTEFAAILSCEIEPLLAAGAVIRFSEDPRISVMRSESGSFMRLVAASDLPPAFIFLDAHYPGAGFGLRDYDHPLPESERLPLARELEHLATLRPGRDVILIDDLRIYETGNWEDGPLPEGTPGTPTPGGADWIRELFAATHDAKTIERDQGYLLLLPKPGR